MTEADVIAVYRRAGELYWHMEKILLIGELSMSCDDNMGFRFEFRTKIRNRPFGASFIVMLEELLLHPDLRVLAKKVATPWVDWYCQKVDEESYKEH